MTTQPTPVPIDPRIESIRTQHPDREIIIQDDDTVFLDGTAFPLCQVCKGDVGFMGHPICANCAEDIHNQADEIEGIMYADEARAVMEWFEDELNAIGDDEDDNTDEYGNDIGYWQCPICAGSTSNNERACQHCGVSP